MRYNGPANSNDRLRGLALDSANNVYVTGVSVGVGSGGDFLTLKISPAGTLVRSMRFAQQGAGTDDAKAIAVDSSDNVYVTGSSSNAFLTLKYDPNGNLLWVQGYRAPTTSEFPVAMKIDPSGNVLIAGVRSSVSNRNDYGLIMYHPSGTFLLEALYNGPANGNDN